MSSNSLNTQPLCAAHENNLAATTQRRFLLVPEPSSAHDRLRTCCVERLSPASEFRSFRWLTGPTISAAFAYKWLVCSFTLRQPFFSVQSSPFWRRQQTFLFCLPLNGESKDRGCLFQITQAYYLHWGVVQAWAECHSPAKQSVSWHCLHCVTLPS